MPSCFRTIAVCLSLLLAPEVVLDGTFLERQLWATALADPPPSVAADSLGQTPGNSVSPKAFTAVPSTGDPVKTTRQPVKMLAAPVSRDGFHFVIYGDRTGGVPEGLKILKQAVADTNLLDPDLVMTVGDLVQGYNTTDPWLEEAKDYKSIMAGLEMPWYPVAGNHDVYWVGKNRPPGHHEQNYERHFGPLWYAFAYKNAGFIVLYSDEGDAETNKKGFNDFGLQQMSQRQLNFLDQALADLKSSDHIFVFLHHPRWTGGNYEGSNWGVVHQKLSDAGNVKAVFAGHIHHMRFDKPDDGIEYYTLGATGGHLMAEIPDAGYLHHINMVSVRKNTFSVSAIPVGAVFDPKKFTAAFLETVDRAREIRPLHRSAPIVIQSDGQAEGEVELSWENEGDLMVSATISLDADSAAGWASTLDHRHLQLPPKSTTSTTFRIRRFSGTESISSIPRIVFTPTLVGDDVSVRLPQVVQPLNIRPGDIPNDYFGDAKKQALNVSGEDAVVEVKSDVFDLPDGPLTLEAWVRPTGNSGYSAIIAKTERSEYSLFSDEGVPQFDIHLGGKYVSAKGNQKLPIDAWTHLAGVFDGQHVMLFVDGKQVADQPGSGARRTNELSLFIGADPDKSNSPTRPFSGLIDEMRLSKKAEYSADFIPARRLERSEGTLLLFRMDRRIGPFAIDHCTRKATGIFGPAASLTPGR